MRDIVLLIINVRTLSGLPRSIRQELRGIFLGAVLIGPFEGSRWRGGCGEGLWDLDDRMALGGRFGKG